LKIAGAAGNRGGALVSFTDLTGDTLVYSAIISSFSGLVNVLTGDVTAVGTAGIRLDTLVPSSVKALGPGRLGPGRLGPGALRRKRA
jgi:hypothetical protein